MAKSDHSKKMGLQLTKDQLEFARKFLMFVICREIMAKVDCGSSYARELFEQVDLKTPEGKSVIQWLANRARAEELWRALSYTDITREYAWRGEKPRTGRFGIPKVSKRLLKKLVHAVNSSHRP